MAGMKAQIERTPEAASGRTPWTSADLALTFVVGLAATAVLLLLLWRVVMPSGLSFGVVVVVSEIVTYACFLMAGWRFALKRRGASLATAGFRPVRLGAILAMIPLTVGVLFVDGIVIQLTDDLFGAVPSAREQLGLGSTSISIEGLLSLLLVGAVIAPIVEELFFRGLLYGYLRGRRGRGVAVAVSSAVFAAMHLIPSLMPSLFLFGAVLALVYERYGSLYPAIALHGLNNGIIFVALYAVQP
jgi:membrane protease YdiL (CAAX protease family)